MQLTIISFHISRLINCFLFLSWAAIICTARSAKSQKSCSAYAKQLFRERECRLFQCKGLTVCTLILCWVAFVGTNLDFTQRAIVLTYSVMSALLHSTFDTLVNLSIHDKWPPELNKLVVQSLLWTAFRFLYLPAIFFAILPIVPIFCQINASSRRAAIQINSVKQDKIEVITTICPARWWSAFSFCAMI